MVAIPTMLVKKTGGPVTRINVADFGRLQGEGYVEYVPSEVREPGPVKTVETVETDPTSAKPTLKELREKAVKLGVINAAKLKEDELVKILAGAEPQAQ